MNDQPVQQLPVVTKQKNPFKLATIILSILVVVLAGWLVFLLISKESVETERGAETQTSKVSDEKGDEKSSSAASVASSEVGPYIKEGYFFVPHWGQKFKLSDELTDYGYSVIDSEMFDFDSYNVGLTAVFKKDLVSNPQQKYYATIETCSFVNVSKTQEDMSRAGGPKKIIPFDKYSFVVYDYGAHGGCPQNSTGLMSSTYYDKVADALTEILSHPENI